IFIGAPGDVRSPMPKGTKLAYLRVYSELEARVLTWVQDPSSERFGLPEMYTIQRANSFGRSGTIATQVHWTRVQHVASDVLDDEILGTPVLRKSWNLFDDLEKVTGGGAEAFWLRANQGMQIDVAPEIELDEPGEAALNKEVDQYQHGTMNRVMKTRGAKVTTLGSDVADFANPA